MTTTYNDDDIEDVVDGDGSGYGYGLVSSNSFFSSLFVLFFLPFLRLTWMEWKRDNSMFLVAFPLGSFNFFSFSYIKPFCWFTFSRFPSPRYMKTCSLFFFIMGYYRKTCWYHDDHDTWTVRWVWQSYNNVGRIYCTLMFMSCELKFYLNPKLCVVGLFHFHGFHNWEMLNWLSNYHVDQDQCVSLNQTL